MNRRGGRKPKFRAPAARGGNFSEIEKKRSRENEAAGTLLQDGNANFSQPTVRIAVAAIAASAHAMDSPPTSPDASATE